MLHTTEHQERGVHCDFWPQRLESSKSFKNKFTIISYLQWKKYANSAKLLKGKTQQQIAALSEKVILAPLYDSPQEKKQLYEDPLFVTKVRSYNSNFSFISMGASLAKNVRVT
jgi:hypothetical protein